MADTAGSGPRGELQDVPRVVGKSLPLRSRRLTAVHLRKLAKALGVPVSATIEDLRLMIDGKLAAMDKEPQNVQVVIADTEEGGVECLVLQDETGVFLRTTDGDTTDEDRTRREDESESGGVDKGAPVTEDTLQAELEEARLKQTEMAEQLVSQQAELDSAVEALARERDRVEILRREKEAEVSKIREELIQEQGKVRYIWRMNCEQLAQYDTESSEKDAEIARLKARLAALGSPEHAPDVVSPPATAPGSGVTPPTSIPVSVVTLPTVDTLPSHATTTPPPGLPVSVSAPLCVDCVPASSSTVTPAVTFVSSYTTPTPTVTPIVAGAVSGTVPRMTVSCAGVSRRGKAPPVDAYTGENAEVRFEDWLPTLDRAVSWNGWTDEESLIQLAGHLRGRALQEWNLLGEEEKGTYQTATQALRIRLDPGNRVLAAQDFRHAMQKDGESVADYVRRLERYFQIAYGRDKLSMETKETILFGQLQEGLSYDIMKSPSVSGSQSYKELCMAAKHEEKRVAELRRRQHYQRTGTHRGSTDKSVPPLPKHQQPANRQRSLPPTSSRNFTPASSRLRKCYTCGSTEHLARDCKSHKGESIESASPSGRPPNVRTKMVTSVMADCNDPLQYMFSSDSDGSEVSTVRVEDKGSKPQKALVDVQGVPAEGVIDSGADITIMGADLFKRVAAVARLKKKQLRKADKVPHTYDQKTFKLDGRIELDITFQGQTMRTPVYLKMDAHDPLLLSEGVCRQLGIISYHPSVALLQPTTKQQMFSTVPTVRVRLVHSVRLPPQQMIMATVQVENHTLAGPVVMEPTRLFSESEGDGVQFGDSLVVVSEMGCARVLLANPTGYTQKLEKGSWIGRACEAICIDTPAESDTETTERDDSVGVMTVMSEINSAARKHKLAEMLAEIGPALRWQDKDQLLQILLEHHTAFAVDEGERGDTDLVQMSIETGEATPKRQPVRRTPFAVREEVAEQLRKMQDQGVIQPSCSPWASPVVLVRKKDGSLRFCIDYRGLNTVTKTDLFPLPRIDDLLDQLGRAKFFSTLDLAAGYWQVQVHPDSREKTAFITHQGLYEFTVMPFGLKNAPAVFQRLMQRVLMGLNPDQGPDFVSVYLDDILVFSETFEKHLEHLQQVIERLTVAGLKLKPSKCHFICQKVEYLGHLITPSGIHPNPNRVKAVREFPVPQSVREVRQFLGVASYYRRFIRGFAKTAQPLHALTQKGAPFEWTQSCQNAFEELKSHLTESPLLAYPDFDKSFILETDASVKGLGAVLSQVQADGRPHPVAYASRALSPQEKHYAVTELESLAVVWAVNHFHAYLYGHDVVVFTDHSAVKAVLETPNPSGKHARWWSKVFGSGVRNINIVYRAGKENGNADALSRCPLGEQPADPILDDTQVAAIHTTEMSARELLAVGPNCVAELDEFPTEQKKDPDIQEIIAFCLLESYQTVVRGPRGLPLKPHRLH